MIDQQEIEDALSRARLRTWRAGKSHDPARGPLGAWLYVIASNCADRVLEIEPRDHGIGMVGDLHPDAAEVDAATDPSRRLADDVRDCLESLPPQQRAVLLADLAAGGAADTEVLAEQLGTTRNSIYVSRNSGRKALHSILLALGHSFVPGTRVGGKEAS